MRLLVLTLVALIGRPAGADACSVSRMSTAYILGSAAGKAPGSRPLIGLWLADGKRVTVRRVADSCRRDVLCKGTEVPIDRTGGFARPKVALPIGARIQIVLDGVLVADDTIVASRPAVLPTGIKLLSAKDEKGAPCEPDGLVVRLDTESRMVGETWLLVYLEKPDPERPFEKLAHVVRVGPEIILMNQPRHPPWLRTLPKRLWVIATDADGNHGPVVQLP